MHLNQQKIFIHGFAAFALLLTVFNSSTRAANPIQVVPTDFSGAKQPQVAVSSAGKIHVTFGKENSVYCASSTDGKSFEQPILVGSLDKLALGMRRGPRIVVASNIVVITAISHADGNLYAWRSTNAGQTWSGKEVINDVAAAAREGLHATASNGSGRFFVTWLDLRNGKMELWSARSDDLGKTWQKNVRVYRSPDGHICECCHPSAVFGPVGEIIVMWRNWLNGGRDMYIAASRDGGKTFSRAAKLGRSSWLLNACPMDGGALAVSPQGTVTTIWRRENAAYVCAAETAEVLLSANARQPVLGAGNNKLYFVWQESEKLIWKSSNEVKSTLFATNAAWPSIASAGANERPVIVWESSQGASIWARVIDR